VVDDGGASGLLSLDRGRVTVVDVVVVVEVAVVGAVSSEVT